MNHKCKLALLLLSSSAYAGWTEKYHNTSQRQFLFAQSQLPHLKLRGDENILDVGCGTGRTTHLFAEHVPQGSILGVDASEDMIEFAQKEYSNATNVRFEVHDATDLKFDQQFDLVYSFFCLQWIDNPQKALDGIAQALKPGGHAYLFVPVSSKDYEIGLACIHKTLEKYPEWRPYCALPVNESADTWIERARKSKLNVVASRIIEKKSTFESKKTWKEYSLGLGITTLSEKENEQFIGEAADLVYKHYGLRDDEPYIRTTNILGLELIREE